MTTLRALAQRAIKPFFAAAALAAACGASAQAPVVPGLQMPLPTSQLLAAPEYDVVNPSPAVTNPTLGPRPRYKETYRYCDGSIVTVSHRVHQNQPAIPYPPHPAFTSARTPSTLQSPPAVSPVGYPNATSAGPQYSRKTESERWLVTSQPILTSPNNPQPQPTNWGITDAYRDVTVWTPLVSVSLCAPPVQQTNTLMITVAGSPLLLQGGYIFSITCVSPGGASWSLTPNHIAIGAAPNYPASAFVPGVPVGSSCTVTAKFDPNTFLAPNVTGLSGVSVGAVTQNPSGYVFTTSPIPAPGGVQPEILVTNNTVNPSTTSLTLYKTNVGASGSFNFGVACQYPTGQAWAPTSSNFSINVATGHTGAHTIANVPLSVTCKLNEVVSTSAWNTPTVSAINVNASGMSANVQGSAYGMTFGPLSSSNPAQTKSISLTNTPKPAATKPFTIVKTGSPNLPNGTYTFVITCQGAAPITHVMSIPGTGHIFTLQAPAAAQACLVTEKQPNVPSVKPGTWQEPVLSGTNPVFGPNQQLQW